MNLKFDFEFDSLDLQMIQAGLDQGKDLDDVVEYKIKYIHDVHDTKDDFYVGKLPSIHIYINGIHILNQILRGEYDVDMAVDSIKKAIRQIRQYGIDKNKLRGMRIRLDTEKVKRLNIDDYIR